MNADLQKALTSLIDETIGEIEELKKSDRFSASEITLGDSEGLKGKDKNGSLDKEEDKKEDEEKKDDEKEDKKDDDMDKAEGKNCEADPNAGNHQPVAKGEMMAGDSDKGSTTSEGAGTNREADPMSKMEDRMAKMEACMEKMEAYMSKAEDKKEDDKEEKKDEDKKEDMKKSDESSEEESLAKSTSDRVASLEKSLESIAQMVKEIADTPVPSQSVSYKDVQPLKKSEDAVEPLEKSQVVEKLFELKKSGTHVDTLDITSAELANPAELVKIANKYDIK